MNYKGRASRNPYCVISVVLVFLCATIASDVKRLGSPAAEIEENDRDRKWEDQDHQWEDQRSLEEKDQDHELENQDHQWGDERELEEEDFDHQLEDFDHQWEDQDQRELRKGIFKNGRRKRRPVRNVINGIGDVADNLGDGRIGDVLSNLPGGNVLDVFSDGFDILDGLRGIGERCGPGGNCPGNLDCQGGPLSGFCLPIKCIREKFTRHAGYFQRMLDIDGGGGIEYAKNYTANNPDEVDQVGDDFSECFDDEDDEDEDGEERRELRNRRGHVHGIGGIGDLSLIFSGTGYYMFVFPRTTDNDKAGNILGMCGGAGAGGGFSFQPFYDMTFAGNASNIPPAWTYLRFELKIPIPPTTFGVGFHLGIGTRGIFGTIGSIGSTIGNRRRPYFAMRITSILPFIGGVGANFVNIQRCRAIKLG